MELLEVLKNRYSCRNFLNKEVEETKINYLLEAVRLTPTACNKFPIRIKVINTKSDIEKAHIATKFNFNEQVIFIFSYDETESYIRGYDNKNYGEVDTSLSIMQLLLAATNIGLATCFIGVFKEDILKQEFNLANNLKIVGLIYCGYPAEGHSSLHNQRPNISKFTI